MSAYKKIIANFKNKRLLVIGDVVLDQYIKGSVTRISPEAPVPVVLQKECFYTPGGAANVANNLSSLKSKVTLAGKIGDDLEGHILKKELAKRKIDTDCIFSDPSQHTILKTRIIAQHQQVVRVDRESARNGDDYDAVKDKKILPFITKNFSKYDAVIISDYGKGMTDATLIHAVTTLAREHKIPVTVDPKTDNFKFYGQVTTITPNKKEAEDALRNIPHDTRLELGIPSVKLDTRENIERAGRGLLKYLGLEALLITLGEHGMYLFEKNKEPFPIPTRAREVFDVSGAGDTVISVFTLALASGATKRQAADLSNYAAGVVVGKLGAVAITEPELTAAIRAHNAAS